MAATTTTTTIALSSSGKLLNSQVASLPLIASLHCTDVAAVAATFALKKGNSKVKPGPSNEYSL